MLPRSNTFFVQKAWPVYRDMGEGSFVGLDEIVSIILFGSIFVIEIQNTKQNFMEF